MTTSDGRWSVGTLVGLPIAGVVTLLLILAAAGLYLLWRNEPKGSYSDRGFFLGGWIGAVLAAVITIGVTVFAYYPFQAEYHQWRTVSGTVTDVGSRLIGQDKSTTQRFVVTLSGAGQRSCDDTRCAGIKVGDYLTLTCKRAWQFTGTDGYDCNFVSVRGAR